MYLFVCLSICLCFLQWQVLNYSCLSLAPWNYQELCFTSPCYLLLGGVAHPQLREAEHWAVVLLFPLSYISFACLSLGVPRSLVLCFRKIHRYCERKGSADLFVCSSVFSMSTSLCLDRDSSYSCWCACMHVCVHVYLNAGVTDIPPPCFQTHFEMIFT